MGEREREREREREGEWVEASGGEEEGGRVGEESTAGWERICMACSRRATAAPLSATTPERLSASWRSRSRSASIRAFSAHSRWIASSISSIVIWRDRWILPRFCSASSE